MSYELPSRHTVATTDFTEPVSLSSAALIFYPSHRLFITEPSLLITNIKQHAGLILINHGIWQPPMGITLWLSHLGTAGPHLHLWLISLEKLLQPHCCPVVLTFIQVAQTFDSSPLASCPRMAGGHSLFMTKPIVVSMMPDAPMPPPWCHLVFGDCPSSTHQIIQLWPYLRTHFPYQSGSEKLINMSLALWQRHPHSFLF